MTTHDRWQRIKEIFQSAQEKTPAERPSFLDAVCGDDPSIREEVEELLTADASNDNDNFLDTPAYEIGAGLIADDTNETIEFSSGQKVGRYTILHPLGAGGMGQIYLAQDEQLGGRKVALKFIAREFATNPRRVLRFEQEALAVSSLNHPNVCVIHETGVENNRHFIAMEYIQGITLRDKLSRETITPLEALQIAIQIAAALASAHAAGIVHRDIKPENIMLRPDGYVKVLDFGLAKLTERVLQPQQVARNITDAGTLMGTVKYMSPEQLRERELDERTDVWSLGVVLYEMLLGTTPFESRIANESIVKILGPQAPALSWPDSLPVRFREIVSKALEKDRDARYPTVNKLAADLNSLRKEIEQQVSNGTFPAEQQIDWYRPPVNGDKTEHLTAGSAIFRRLKSQAFSTADFLFSEFTTNRTAAAIFTSVTGALVFLLLIPNATQFVHRLVSSIAEQQAFKVKLTPFTNSGTSKLAAYSPDGRLVAHVEEEHGKQRLVVSSTTVTGSADVVPPEEVRYLGITFSRDNYLYLTRKEKDGGRILYRLPYLGTPGVRPVAARIKTDIDSPVSLSPQGDQFAFVRYSEALSQYAVVVSDIDGGNERVLITRKGGSTLSTHGLSWSPDGNTIVCAAGFWNQSFHTNLIAIDVKTGKERVLGRPDWFYVNQVAWQPDNSGLIICAREEETTPFQLWRVSYPDGRVEQVTNDTNEYWGVSIAGDKIVTVKTGRSWHTWVTSPGERASSVQIASGSGFTYGMSWSPQGYIVHSSMLQDKMNIGRIDPDGSNSRPLTTAAINYSPVVSADGRYVVFSSNLDGRFNIWRMNASDGSDLKQLTFTDANYYPSISPDGKWVAYDNLTGSKVSIWKVPLEGGEPVKIIDGYRMPVFSPDSRLIAARYDEDSGSTDVAIFSADGGEALERMPVPIIEWQTVRWLGARALSYIRSENGASNIYSYDLDTRFSKQLTFFDTDQIAAYAWSPDFKQVACQRVRNTGDVILISSER